MMLTWSSTWRTCRRSATGDGSGRMADTQDLAKAPVIRKLRANMTNPEGFWLSESSVLAMSGGASAASEPLAGVPRTLLLRMPMTTVTGRQVMDMTASMPGVGRILVAYSSKMGSTAEIAE